MNKRPFPKLTDTSKMPFGKHKGELMQDIPASYLHFLWASGMKDDKQSGGVVGYIRDNLDALKQDHPDGIWT